MTRHGTSTSSPDGSDVSWAATAARRLAEFVGDSAASRPDELLLHDAKRLLLNQLKASAEACTQVEGQQWLARGAALAHRRDRSGTAQLWWSGTRSSPRHAAALNRRLLSLLDFGDTHLPSLGEFTAGMLPPLLAHAEDEGRDGQRLLCALVIGLEVAIACASGPPRPMHALHVGTVAGLCTLRAHSPSTTATLLHQAMAACAPDDTALASLGRNWRLRDIALHCRPAPVSALAPLDAVLGLRLKANELRLRRLRVRLSGRAWQQAGPERAGGFDLRHGLAAAWLLGDFGADERRLSCHANPEVLDLATRIELEVDPEATGIESCSLDAFFDDNSSQQVRLDTFLGASRHPLSDSQLSELFRGAAEPLVLPLRAGEILHALWGLDRAPDVRQLTRLLARPA